jgi:hypothetical protein
MDQPCGKRMKDMLPLCSAHLDCPEEIRSHLGGISAASIDRLLKSFKVSAGKKVRPPKPASAVKALVKVRAKLGHRRNGLHRGGHRGALRRGHGIEQTRSRSYFKNEQAYVEQKNYTHVRQFLGYDRLEHR